MPSKRGIRALLGILALGLAAVWPPLATAQPLSGDVIEDATISGRCLVVRFSFPLQYLSHFPNTKGTYLLVRLRPILPAGRIDRDTLHGREVAHPPGREKLHIVEVAYEGGAFGGPYLVVVFDKDVRFRIAQGSDFRSFVIAVGDGGAPPPCFPKT